MANQNRQFKLAARPVGMVKRSDFEFTCAPAPEPGPGEVLVRVMYVSLDPAMRGRMNEGRSYIAPVGLGEVMRAGETFPETLLMLFKGENTGKLLIKVADA